MSRKRGKLTLCLAFLCALLFSGNASAQSFVRYIVPSDLGTKVLYSDALLSSITLPQGVSRVDNNMILRDAAFELSQILGRRDVQLLRVYVSGSASPDGLWQDNENLSQARTDAAVRYLRYVTGVPLDKIHAKSLVEDWDRLYELVAQSDIPYKDQVLQIIAYKTWGDRKTALRNLAGGMVWKILVDDFFPQLRCVRIAFYCQWDPTKPYLNYPAYSAQPYPYNAYQAQPSYPYQIQQPYPYPASGVQPAPVAPVSPTPVVPATPAAVEMPAAKVPGKDTIYVRDTVYMVKETVYIQKEPKTVISDEVPETRRYQAPVKSEKAPVAVKAKENPLYDVKSRMAIKTNALSDVIALPTLGLEFQIGRRFSFDAQALYSPFNIFNPGDKNTKIYAVSPEFRFWLGGEAMQKAHFLGLHANMMWYTLQWTDGFLYQNGSNIQNSGQDHDSGNSLPAWSIGLTYGYSLNLSRNGNWGLEFVIGLGYAQYSQNLAVNDQGIWKFVEHQENSGFKITRLGVNFSYRIPLKKEKIEK